MARTKTTTSKVVVPVECKVRELDKPYRVCVALHLDPVPASRPRVTRWGTYYGKTYTRWRKTAAASVPLADCPFPKPQHLHVDVAFVVKKPKTSKLTTPRADIDNYMKAIFDVLTDKEYWDDDVQVVSVNATKRFASANEVEGTFVAIRST